MTRDLIHKIFGIFFNEKQEPEIIPRTILVIDDGEVERRFIGRTLEKTGFKVLMAENGEAGILLAQENIPHLILLDYVMPGIHGDEVCRRLKENDKTKGIPVVFLTGSVKPKIIIDSYESGAEYYLAKPISGTELISQVENILREQKQSLSS